MFCALISVVLVISSLALGRISGRAAEIVFFMLLTLPWWFFQSYDAALGPAVTSADFLRTSGQCELKGTKSDFSDCSF